jgi:hypothetical protein
VTHYVERTELERLYAELLAEYRRVRCPNCKLPVKLGRKAHARCLGALGARVYWRPEADAATRAELAQEHSELVRRVLDARPPREIADWYWHRFGSTKKAGQLAKVIAESEGKKVGPAFSAVDAEKARRILKLADEKRPDGKPRHSQRAIARLVGVSRGCVENVLRNREGVISHFRLDEVA